MRFLTRYLTFANVAATLALVLAVSGTSYAALTITGRNVRDSTLTGADFKFGSLTTTDFSIAAKAALRGPKGDTGTQGATGTKGVTGAKGPTGVTGAPANVRGSWASWDAGYIKVSDAGGNTGGNDWFDWESVACTTPDCHLIAANAANAKSLDSAAAGTTVIDLNTIAPAGGAGGSNGPVTTAWQDTTMMAWATVTLLYRTESDGAPLNTRAECWITIGGVKASPSMLVSGSGQRETETMSIVGNLQRPPGTYNAAVVCRDADGTAGRTRWQAVRANLTLMANERAADQ